DDELDRVAQMDVEPLLWLQSSPHEEVGGAVDEPVELAPREPRRHGAVGVLEAEERPVRKAPRFVRESITERARADDVHAPRYSRLTTSVSRRPAAGPASETWPDSRTYARSASSSAMEAFCSTSRIVRPRSGSARIVRAISATTIGARPSDGSSSSRYFGFAMRPRAMASICCSPPDSEPPSCVRRSPRRGKSS